MRNYVRIFSQLNYRVTYRKKKIFFFHAPWSNFYKNFSAGQIFPLITWLVFDRLKGGGKLCSGSKEKGSEWFLFIIFGGPYPLSLKGGGGKKIFFKEVILSYQIWLYLKSIGYCFLPSALMQRVRQWLIYIISCGLKVSRKFWLYNVGSNPTKIPRSSNGRTQYLLCCDRCSNHSKGWLKIVSQW